MKNFISLVAVILLLILVSYTESSDLNRTHIGSLSYSTDSSSELLVSAELNEENVSENIVPVLELKLVERKEMDNGNYMEIYQEYEVFKDADGKITKSVPTGHYEYLKYEM